MSELIKNYIGKECVVYISNGSNAVSGIVSKVEEGWIEVKKQNEQTELLNIDYISRIQEYPRNKNGKKKAVFTD